MITKRKIYAEFKYMFALRRKKNTWPNYEDKIHRKLNRKKVRNLARFMNTPVKAVESSK